MMKICVFLLAALLSFTAKANALTFSQIREKFSDKTVVVTGRSNDGKLSSWYTARRRPDGTVQYSVLDNAPDSYRNSQARVVSVELTEKPKEQSDVFGKPVDIGRIKNPYVEVVVQLEDGKEIVTRSFASTFNGENMHLVEDASRSKLDIEKVLVKLIGKSVFLPMYQKLYPAETSLELLQGPSYKRSPLSFTEYPRATALKVIDAKYLDGHNLAIIKIALPGGGEGIMSGSTEHFYLERSYKASELDRLGFYAEQSLKGFTAREIASIKKVEFYPGMSKRALYWSVGLSEKTNDYGRAGEQLIFPTGLIVYIKNDRVSSYQRL